MYPYFIKNLGADIDGSIGSTTWTLDDIYYVESLYVVGTSATRRYRITLPDNSIIDNINDDDSTSPLIPGVYPRGTTFTATASSTPLIIKAYRARYYN